MYQVIGNDGKTYGPAGAEQIREWIAQGRLDNRTPVLPEGAMEWTYLGLLPEFTRECGGTPPVISPPRPAKKTNGFATAGFVCGLLSIPAFCCGGCPFNLLGLVFSIVALVQINRQVDKDNGWGLALAGLICSAVSLLFGFGLGLLHMLLTPGSVIWHVGTN
jgi:hypothetical protein